MSSSERKASDPASPVTADSIKCEPDIKSEPPEPESHSDGEGGDNNEEAMYKNLTEEQLQRARLYNECFICQKRLKNFSTFRNHVFLHTKAEKFRCDKCFKEFAQLKYLKAHMTTHNENRIFTCEICSQNFATKSSIRGHMRVHTGEKPYKCQICERAFSESSSRRKHMLTHFPERENQLRMERYPCEICGKLIKGQDSFKRHMRIHTGEKNVECPICSKSFAMKSWLRAHLPVHTDRPMEHICKLCSKAFYHRSSLWRHMKRPCAQPKPPANQCELCAQVFKQIVAQMQGDEKGRCNLCGKTYRTARGLSVHIRTHITDKRFQCIICANKYTPPDGNSTKSLYDKNSKN